MARAESSPAGLLSILLAGSVLLALIAGLLLDSSGRGAHDGADATWRSLSVEELIDQLVHVDEEGFDVQDASGHCTGYFVAVESLAECSLDDSPLTTPPAFRELVRRGTAALPGLLEHLTDDRRTRLRLRTFAPEETWADVPEDDPAVGPFADISFYQEYFPRRPSACTPETPTSDGGLSPFTDAVVLANDFRSVDAYTVRVGDLCYFVVGQIVNRPLESVVYGGSNCIMLYSPVQDPVLADAVRQDWMGLSIEAHYKSLVSDAHDRDTARAVGAIKRRSFYYPDRTESVFVDLLARRVYDTSAGMDLVDSGLIESGDESEWRARYRQVRETHGVLGASVAILLLKEHGEEVCRTIHFLSRPGTSISGSSIGDQREDFERRYAKTQQLLAVLESEPGELLPPEELVEVWHQVEIIPATRVLKSARVDQAVYESFVRTKAEGQLDGWMLQALAEACLERLAGTSYEDDFREFLNAQAASQDAPACNPDAEPQ